MIVKPLPLEPLLKLLILLAPYLVLMEKHLPEINRLLKDKSGGRPRMLSSLFFVMREEFAMLPGDMTKCLAVMLDCDPEWLAKTVLPEEFVAAFPILDRVNDFKSLAGLAHQMGLTINYG